jgi:hypothetical protein
VVVAVRWQPRRSRRFSAYRTGDYWVTVEWLAHTDDPLVRWVWTTRTIQFVTAGGAVVPSREPVARGYAYTKAEARGRAHTAAVIHASKE